MLIFSFKMNIIKFALLREKRLICRQFLKYRNIKKLWHNKEKI